jgi:outer membrane receptor for ferrienterochelin and colicin
MRSRHIRSNTHPISHRRQPPGRPLPTTVAAAVAAILAGPTVVWAQSADATLSGYASPGVTVTVHNTATGLTRHSVAGGDGRFVIPGLPPGDYAVDAGPGTEQTVTLQVATTTQLDLKLAQITVTGSHVPVHQETLTSEVGTVVSLHDIDNLPQYTRNFLEFANQVSGMQFNVDSTGNTNLRGGAQLYSNINVYIDGVSQKDYVNGGVTGQEGPGQAGDPGNPFPQLAIDEYKVITSNYKAEYGDAASAIIIAQTKSGTNHFEGGSFLTFTNQNLRAMTPAEMASGLPKQPAPSWEYGASEGGPIIPDKLHFFVTWERKTLSEQNVVFPGGGVDPATVLPQLPASVVSQFGPTTNPFSENLGFAKLDYEPTDADRLELSAKIRDERQLVGAAGQTAASAATHYKNDDTRYMLLWVHNWQNLLNEVRVTHQNTTSNSNALPSQQFQYHYFPNFPNFVPDDNIIDVNGPGAGVGFRYDQSGTGIQDDLTFANLGGHTLKVGARFQAIDLTAESNTVDLNDAVYYEALTGTGVYANPYLVQFPVSFPGIGAPRVDSKDKQFGLYIQDDWTVNPHVTLNLGLRWDYEKVPLFNDYTTPASVVTALNSPGTLTNCLPAAGGYAVGTGNCYDPNVTYAQLLAKSFPGSPGININDYISTGSNRKAPTDQFQPRFGFAYDINADQQYVVFGGYGRSYDRNLFSQLAYETTKVGLYNNPQIYFPTPYTNDFFGPCHTAADVNPANHCYTWNSSYLTAAGLATIPVATSSHEVDLIKNNIKAPHSDQFSIGFRTRLADWDAALTFADIKSYDATIGHLGLRYADGSYYSNQGAPWGAFGSLQGYGALILWDNAGEDTNQQVTLSLNKAYTPASGWSASFAYTYSNAYQNNVAGPLNPYQGSPNAYLFDLPNPKDYPLLPSTAVPKHRLVATGSYDLPGGFTLAGRGEISSATYLDMIFGCPFIGPSPPGVGSTFPTLCNNGIGGNAFPISAKIPNAIGYRDLDLSLAKKFNLFRDIKGTVRFDILNIFNYTNYDPNAATWTVKTSATFPSPYYIIEQPHYTANGPIVGFPRTLKLTGQLTW